MNRLAEIIGSDGWIAAMGIAFFFGIGELIHRAVTGYHRVPHRKLRAAAHLHPQSDVPEVALGSSAPSGEPLPASLTPLEGAGTNLQPGLSRLDQGRRRDHSSEQPHPAPGTTSPGAGPDPRAAPTALAAGSTEPVPASGTLAGIPGAGPTTRVTAAPTRMSADADPDRDADTSSRTAVSASPQRPAAAVNPDSAAADLPPGPGAVRGAGPSCVAADGPVRGAA